MRVAGSSASSSTAVDYIPLQDIYSRKSITSTSSVCDTESTFSTAKPLKYNEFTPVTSLQIHSLGHPLISLPLAPTELEIPIFNPATSRPVYLSIRPKRWSGSCRLVLAEDEGDEARVSSTTYRFGPLHPPVVKIWIDGTDRTENGDIEQFEVVSAGIFTRSVRFDTRWGRFEWRYGSRNERKDCAAHSLLVLEQVADSGDRRVVARFVRNDVLRTPGTRSSTAGNGGRLEMDLGKVSEVMVVATVLVMMKKEVDRMRMYQMAAISGASGGP